MKAVVDASALVDTGSNGPWAEKMILGGSAGHTGTGSGRSARFPTGDPGRVLRNPPLGRRPMANYLVSGRRANRCHRFSAFSWTGNSAEPQDRDAM